MQIGFLVEDRLDGSGHAVITGGVAKLRQVGFKRADLGDREARPEGIRCGVEKALVLIAFLLPLVRVDAGEFVEAGDLARVGAVDVDMAVGFGLGVAVQAADNEEHGRA